MNDLIDAAKKNDLALLEKLLKAGANPDAQDEHGMTALMWATLKSYAEAARLLLKSGADPNIHAADGVAAIMMTAIQGGVAKKLRSCCLERPL